MIPCTHAINETRQSIETVRPNGSGAVPGDRTSDPDTASQKSSTASRLTTTDVSTIAATQKLPAKTRNTTTEYGMPAKPTGTNTVAIRMIEGVVRPNSTNNLKNGWSFEYTDLAEKMMTP